MRRKTLAFCILISIVAIASADTFATSYEANPTKKKGAGAPFRISRGKLWGYMDRTGKVIIEPQFRSVSDFFNGRAAVLKNNKWGYINEKGEAVIPFSFDRALDFTGEIAPVLVGRKWGYIDLSGRWIVSPQFQAAGEVSNGFARILLWNRIRCSGGTYTNRNAPIYAYHLPTLITSLTIGCFPENRRYGFIDTAGKFVVQPNLFDAEDFSDGLAPFTTKNKSGYKYGFVDASGVAIIAPQFEDVQNFSEGLAAAQLNGKYGYIDKSGKWVIKPKFDFGGPFSEGLARIVIDGKTGYIDKNARMVIAPQFSTGWDFSEGLASIYNDKNREFGYIDQSGKIVLRLGRARWGFSDGLTIVGESPNRVYMDKQGKVIAPYEVGYTY